MITRDQKFAVDGKEKEVSYQMSLYSTSSKTFPAGPPPDKGEGEDAHQDADQHSVQLRVQTTAGLSKFISLELPFETNLAL